MWGSQNKAGTSSLWGSQNKTGTQQNSSSTTSGFSWGSGNKTTTTGFGIGTTSQTTKKQVPATTAGISFEPSTIELFVKEKNDNEPFAVNHIINYEIFKQYTIEELRYYDYLSHDYCKPPTQTTGLSGFQNKSSTSFSSTQTNKQSYPVSPWKKEYPPSAGVVPKSNQAQPYGAFPTTQLSVTKMDYDNDETEYDNFPERRSFLNPKRIYI